jgi:AraC family transcriptional regulator of arabinose operon
MDYSTSIKDGFVGQKSFILPNNIVSTIKSNTVASLLYATDVGYFPNARHHFRQRRRGCQQYIFIYCVEGCGWVKVAKKILRVLPNQFIIIPKNTPHSYWADEKTPWSIYWMHFEGSISDHIYDKYTKGSDLTQTVPFTDERLSLFGRVIDVLNSGFNDEKIEYASIACLNFLSSFIYFQLELSTEPSNNDNLVDNIINYLNSNLDKTITTQEIVEQFHYSHSYLFSVFKKKTGYSIIHFFNLLKIQKACEYLNFTGLSVKEICFKMGFQDPLYFSRLFKKYMGLAPTEYRNELID